MKKASLQGTRDQEEEEDAEVDEQNQSNVIFMHRISVFVFIPKINGSILNQG